MPILPQLGTCDCGAAFAPASTFITTPGAGLFVVPVDATMVMFDAVAPGGGGGGGAAVAATVNGWGGGGGGGGGRTTKWVNAAALRAAYPGGVPYVVGAPGVGGAPGVAGTAGGYTFCSDFFVATPGQGGGPGGNGNDPIAAFFTTGYGGANGLGDTYGGFGGFGGGYIFEANQQVNGAIDTINAPDYRGTNGGYIVLLIPAGIGVPEFVQLGGAGGGGGGGGIRFNIDVVLPPNTPYNGGNSGFVTTSAPTPLFGAGGIVGGAGPTTGGVPSIAASGVANQGAGGGGAASLAGNAQSGASALPFSSGGGGGGGSCRTGQTPGSGGNAGSGYLRITTI